MINELSKCYSISAKSDFKWEGAGQQLFATASEAEKSKNDSGAGEDAGAGADEEYDPHYEPIVPLPEKIVVTTGEEDEVISYISIYISFNGKLAP